MVTGSANDPPPLVVVKNALSYSDKAIPTDIATRHGYNRCKFWFEEENTRSSKECQAQSLSRKKYEAPECSMSLATCHVVKTLVTTLMAGAKSRSSIDKTKK